VSDIRVQYEKMLVRLADLDQAIEDTKDTCGVGSWIKQHAEYKAERHRLSEIAKRMHKQIFGRVS